MSQGQASNDGKKLYKASFVPCPNCGRHGEIVVEAVSERSGSATPFPHQGQVMSHEKAIMQAAGLLTDGYIDADGFRSLIQQILVVEMFPTEELVAEAEKTMGDPLRILLAVIASSLHSPDDHRASATGRG